MTGVGLFTVISAILVSATLAPGSKEYLTVSLSWGHQTLRSTPYHTKLLAESAEIRDAKANDLESNDTKTENLLTTHAGSGDENSRLRIERPVELNAGGTSIEVQFEPYGVRL